MNRSAVPNAVIGGWTAGMVLTYQSGEPHLFTGGTQTFNQNDAGIALTGVTVAQLQHQIRPRRVAGHPWVSMFDPKYISAEGQANSAYIAPQQIPGQIGTLMWLHDPKWINTDLAIRKSIPLYRELNFKLQGEFLNAFNHTAWSGLDAGVQDTTFGTTTATANSPRNIEIRANFQF